MAKLTFRYAFVTTSHMHAVQPCILNGACVLGHSTAHTCCATAVHRGGCKCRTLCIDKGRLPFTLLAQNTDGQHDILAEKKRLRLSASI